jgi:hypothetical protein
MIVTSRLDVTLCCLPMEDPCYRDDHAEAMQHARERAESSGRRQFVARRVWADITQRRWLIVTLADLVQPATWTFDGRTYRIVDTQS